jgi:hypothetical protein
MRHRRSLLGLITLAAILATFLVFAATASAVGDGNTTSDAHNGTGDYEWMYQYMNTGWSVQLHANDPEGVAALWWRWDGGAGISTGYSGVGGGDTDVYRSHWISVNRTTHADDGLHTLGTIARGFWYQWEFHPWPVWEIVYYLDTWPDWWSHYVWIDSRAPALSQSGADAAWHNAPVPIAFNAADPLSGLRVIQAAVDGAAPISQNYQVDSHRYGPATATMSYTFPAPADHSGDGVHTIVYHAYDWSYPFSSGMTEEHTCQVKIDTVAPVTTQAGGNSGVHDTPVTVTFSAYDPNPPNCSGVNYTQYQVDGGGWVTGGSVTIPAPPHTTVTHNVQYRSVDNAGNVEATNSCEVQIGTDSVAPVTTVSGADDNWHNAPVTLTFSASDPAPNPSGVDYTEYQIDGGSWVHGTSCTVPAPADHSGDGVVTVSYRSVDLGDNTEATKTCPVKIDTTGPTTTASAAVTVKKGKKATFRFSFTDLSPASVALSPTATVKIVITKGAVTKKTLNVGERAAGAALVYRWTCSLKAGRYKWSVRATDLAGNPQAVSGTKNLTVK